MHVGKAFGQERGIVGQTRAHLCKHVDWEMGLRLKQRAEHASMSDLAEESCTLTDSVW